MTIVVGNPKAHSRTRHAAELVYQAVLGRPAQTVLELSEVGPHLLGWGSAEVAGAVLEVQRSPFVIVASPTYKATYTGLLKLFLDQFAGGTGMQDVVVLPLMLGAGAHHALAGETHLKPVLAELGAITTSPALFLLDSSYEEDGLIASFAERWGAAIRDAVEGAERRRGNAAADAS